MKILCEVSLGELVDKISILRIKLKKITDSEKVKHVDFEHRALCSTLNDLELNNINHYLDKLELINSDLWEIEDDIRECEMAKDFSSKFVELARSVYVTNDQRFAVKNEINTKFGSSIKEVKSYEEY